MTKTTLHYTDKLVRSAVAAFWWRTVGWQFVAVLLFLTGYLVFATAIGERSWLTAVAAVVLALGILLVVGVYMFHLRGSLARFRRLRVKQAALEATSERLKLSSDMGSSDVAWSVVGEVWRFDDFWLLLFSRSQFVTLPLADISDEARQFILERVRSHGGKVL